jgi:mannosyl-3-phosphoglycerate phosphatase
MNLTLVFTDLDGTLIDHDTYDFAEAQPALDQLRARSIPVIFCTSKTRAEIEIYRQRMNLDHPFICENGGAIFLPKSGPDVRGIPFVQKDHYRVIELGMPHADLCSIWKSLKFQEGFPMEGFSDMALERIMAETNLSREEAALAAKREYTEPFKFSGTPAQFDLFEKRAREEGLKITKGGRFHHLIGDNDKGKALQILRGIYANAHPKRRIVTVGLGDSANDIPMLQQVDVPVVVRRKTGDWERIGAANAIYTEEAGPRGWAEAIGAILKKMPHPQDPHPDLP